MITISIHDWRELLRQGVVVVLRSPVVVPPMAYAVDSADIKRKFDSLAHKKSHWWKNVTPDELKAEIAAGADVNAKDDDDRTPLHSAVTFSKVEIVDALLRAGANVIAVDKGGRTPLHNAARNAKVDVVRVLFVSCLKNHKWQHAANAKENKYGRIPLHEAAENNNSTKVIDVLLFNNEQTVNTQDKHDYSPLDLAVNNKNKHVANRLKVRRGEHMRILPPVKL